MNSLDLEESGWIAGTYATYDLDEDSHPQGWRAYPTHKMASLCAGKPQASNESRLFRQYLAEYKIPAVNQVSRWVWLSGSRTAEYMDYDAIVSAVSRVFDGPAHLTSALVERRFRSYVSLCFAKDKLRTIQHLQSNDFVVLFTDQQESVGRSLTKIPQWFEDFYGEPKDNTSRSSQLTLIREINNLLIDENLELINLLLAEADFTRLAPGIIMGLVRSTANARCYLVGWRSATKRAHAELEGRGLPADRILTGLLDI